jgi:hypothetical protein
MFVALPAQSGVAAGNAAVAMVGIGGVPLHAAGIASKPNTMCPVPALVDVALVAEPHIRAPANVLF